MSFELHLDDFSLPVEMIFSLFFSYNVVSYIDFGYLTLYFCSMLAMMFYSFDISLLQSLIPGVFFM